MSSIKVTERTIDLKEYFEDPEVYNISKGRILIVSQDIHYAYYDCINETLISEGKFQGDPDDYVLPGYYTYWLCAYDNFGKILFYSVKEQKI